MGTAAPAVGYTAAAFTAVNALPQLVKIARERSVRDVSLLTFACATTGSVLWVAYGVMGGDVPIIVSSAVAAALGGGVTAVKAAALLRGAWARRRGGRDGGAVASDVEKDPHHSISV